VSGLQFIAEEGLAHAVSQEMGDTAIRWFKKHLRACEFTPVFSSILVILFLAVGDYS